MKLTVVILGFIILVFGVLAFSFITSFGPTIWILYPWLGFPNPFWFLNPVALVFILFGIVLTGAGFILEEAPKK